MPDPSAPDQAAAPAADPHWKLHRATINSRVINDACQYDPDNQTIRVVAEVSRKFPTPARVHIGVNGAGFSLDSYVTPESARAVAMGLLQAANLCDAYEADLTAREEHEMALLNMTPVQRVGGVVACETATEGGAA